MEITNHTAHLDRHIIVVKGLVKEQDFDKIRQALATAPTSNNRELWIDCSHVDRLHLTNSSICSFVNELLKIRKQDVKVMLCGMNATTERLFQLLRLDTLFEKVKTMEAAYQPEKQQPIAA